MHVPYKGQGPANGDLMAGRLQIGLASTPTYLAALKDKRLRALAVTSLKRSTLLPEVPVAEDEPCCRHPVTVMVF